MLISLLISSLLVGVSNTAYWDSIDAPSSPDYRFNFGYCHNPKTNSFFIFSGTSGNTGWFATTSPMQDIWSYTTTNTWSQISAAVPSSTDPILENSKMVVNAPDGVIYIYGGSDPNAVSSTKLYRYKPGSGFTAQKLIEDVGGLPFTDLVQNPITGNLVLFSLSNSPGSISQFVGSTNNWGNSVNPTKSTVRNAPSARWDYLTAVDSIGKVMYLYGGRDVIDGPIYNEIYKFDFAALAWTSIDNATNVDLTGVVYYQMLVHPWTGDLVLHGFWETGVIDELWVVSLATKTWTRTWPLVRGLASNPADNYGPFTDPSAYTETFNPPTYGTHINPVTGDLVLTGANSQFTTSWRFHFDSSFLYSNLARYAVAKTTTINMPASSTASSSVVSSSRVSSQVSLTSASSSPAAVSSSPVPTRTSAATLPSSVLSSPGNVPGVAPSSTSSAVSVSSSLRTSSSIVNGGPNAPVSSSSRTSVSVGPSSTHASNGASTSSRLAGPAVSSSPVVNGPNQVSSSVVNGPNQVSSPGQVVMTSPTPADGPVGAEAIDMSSSSDIPSSSDATLVVLPVVASTSDAINAPAPSSALPSGPVGDSKESSSSSRSGALGQAERAEQGLQVNVMKLISQPIFMMGAGAFLFVFVVAAAGVKAYSRRKKSSTQKALLFDQSASTLSSSGPDSFARGVDHDYSQISQVSSGTMSSYSAGLTGSVGTDKTATIAPADKGLALPGFLLVEAGSDFRARKQLAKGGFGVVELGDAFKDTLKKHGDKVVIKRMLRDKLSEKEQKMFYQEISIMYYLNEYKNIAKIVGYSMSPFCIVMKYYAGGSLDVWLKNKKMLKKKSTISSFLHDISNGVLAIHQHGFVHYDLKPQNILLDTKDDRTFCVITDFGVTQIVNDSALKVDGFQVVNINAVSMIYAAPEVIRRVTRQATVPAAFPSDVYSFAMIMLEILTGKIPWISLKNSEVASSFNSGENSSFNTAGRSDRNSGHGATTLVDPRTAASIYDTQSCIVTKVNSNLMTTRAETE